MKRPTATQTTQTYQKFRQVHIYEAVVSYHIISIPAELADKHTMVSIDATDIPLVLFRVSQLTPI